MRMLTRDGEMFHSRFHEAAVFVQAASLRYECYELACLYDRIPMQARRLQDLLHSPACRETWFVVQLRGDARRNQIEGFLLAAGL